MVGLRISLARIEGITLLGMRTHEFGVEFALTEALVLGVGDGDVSTVNMVLAGEDSCHF